MKENAKQFLEWVSQRPEKAGEVKELKDPDAVARYAKANGFELSPEDLKVRTNVEMDEDEMSAVSGGGECYCIEGGGGTPGPDVKACACVVLGFGYNKQDKSRCMCYAVGMGDNR